MSNFSFTKIDVPAAAGTYAYISADGVDAAGEAVGNYGNVDGDGDGTFDGFVTEGSSGTTYNPPGSTNTDVVGITSSGEIFGNYVDNVLHQHGFVDNAGVVTKVDVLLAKYRMKDGGFESYEKLSDKDRTSLKAPVTTLAEDLSALKGALGVE